MSFFGGPIPLWGLSAISLILPLVLIPNAGHETHMYGLAYGALIAFLKFRFKLF